MNLSSFGRRWITLANAAIGRSALGLGTAATVDTGTTTGTVPLNDVGTFTPAFAATGATFSYSSRTGVYTKIGRVVYFTIDIVLNTSGNTLTANTLTITGLPFTVNAGMGQGYFPVRWSASTTSYVGMNVRIPGGGTSLTIEAYTAIGTSNATATPNSDAALHATNGSTMRVVGFYIV